MKCFDFALTAVIVQRGMGAPGECPNEAFQASLRRGHPFAI
jgi:hypothetical protein